jgi:UDP-N-acetylmuramoylalanine--D-glutamate ligase
LCPARIIGITGANGKSTTTALTAHLLEHGKDPADSTYGRVRLGGNIGNRPLLTTLDRISPADLVVLELSSFQLEQLADFRLAPHVALLTNLTPNHLDRHGTFEDYCAAKENIFTFQKPYGDMRPISIFNGEDEIGAKWYAAYSEDDGRTCIKYACHDVPDNLKSVYTLPGSANLSNLAGALAIARRFGVSESRIVDTLPSFKALPHRLEFVREVSGVRWYNDSIATTPPSTIAALEAFDRSVVLIAGGYDKKLPFDELGEMIARKAKSAVLIGQTAGKIAEAIAAADPEGQANVETVDSLAKAVERAGSLAEAGDVVLLSPACASYDLFDNFQQRGDQFAELVKEIPSKL